MHAVHRVCTGVIILWPLQLHWLGSSTSTVRRKSSTTIFWSASHNPSNACWQILVKIRYQFLANNPFFKFTVYVQRTVHIVGRKTARTIIVRHTHSAGRYWKIADSCHYIMTDIIICHWHNICCSRARFLFPKTASNIFLSTDFYQIFKIQSESIRHTWFVLATPIKFGAFDSIHCHSFIGQKYQFNSTEAL